MNLLPPELRPRDGARRGSSYVVIGGLTVAVVAMLAYALVLGGVRSDEAELASLKGETAEANARAEALRPYGDFAAMKEQREQSVRTVAEARFDYERLTRELTRILPSGVWVSHLDVAPAVPDPTTAAEGADPVTGSTVQPPAMTVSGCAPGQAVVADTLDRLRAITGAVEVELGSSTDAGDALSPSAPRPRLSSSAGPAGCGKDGMPRVEFDATVTLTAPAVEALAAPATTPTATTVETGS
ncbi:MAG TPA: hypothetical protein VD790_11440 [Thermoleophilaceae bacterium]|nr:hypothetical protein [Thermoleophilaceae bacterium]